MLPEGGVGRRENWDRLSANGTDKIIVPDQSITPHRSISKKRKTGDFLGSSNFQLIFLKNQYFFQFFSSFGQIPILQSVAASGIVTLGGRRMPLEGTFRRWREHSGLHWQDLLHYCIRNA